MPLLILGMSIAEPSAAFRAVNDGVLQMRGALLSVIERGQERSEISQNHESREIVASMLGPLLYRRFFSREPLDQAFVKRVVERALRKPD